MMPVGEMPPSLKKFRSSAASTALMRGWRLLKLGVGQHLPVGRAEPADEGAVARVDHGLREAGGRHRRGGNRRLLIDHDHRDGAEHDEGADRRQQHAQGLPQRPVPPPAALDLDPGPVQPAAPRSAEAPRASRPPRPAGSARAAAAAPAAGQLGSPQAPGGLGFPPQLAGLLGACRGLPYARGCRPFGPGARGRDPGGLRCRTPPPSGHRQCSGHRRFQRACRHGRARGCRGSPLRDGGTLACPSPQRHSPGRSRHPPRCPDSPHRPPGARAPPCLNRDTERQSHQLCCSRALAGGSEVAAVGMRPLPERRVRPTREPAELKRYLLGRLFTGWSVHAASGVPQARQCPERRRKQGGSTRNFGRLRPHRPGIRRIRPPFPRVRGLA